MTLSEQGAYRNLLDEQRLRGGAIPNDDRILARACGDPLEWPNMRDKIMRWFDVSADGKTISNKTATEINDTSDALSSERSEAGRRGFDAVQRGSGGLFTGKPTGKPTGKRSGNATGKASGSVSVVRNPLPLSVTGSEETATEGADAPPKEKPPKPVWNGEAAELWWSIYNGKPTEVYFAQLKPIVAEYGWERVRPALVTYMAETDIAFVNIASKFGGGFGVWEARAKGAARASPQKETVADRSRRLLGLPARTGGQGDNGKHAAVGASQLERGLQPGAERGRDGSVPEDPLGPDGHGVPRSGA